MRYYQGCKLLLLRLCAIGLIVGLPFIRHARADCECGYLIKDQRYTHSIITNFARIVDFDDISDGSGNELNDWEVMEWGTGAQTRGTETVLPKQNNATNVWIQGGQLHLRQKGYSDDDLRHKRPVSIAEIVTKRDDIFYGSFRATFRIQVEENTEGGGVAGFFFYRNQNAESDIEILTRDDQTTVHYSQQPTYNYDTDESYGGSTLERTLTTPWTVAQEHRWDWFPDGSTFYQHGIEAAKVTYNTPQKNGTINFNMWADNGEWSGRPATKDIILQIQNVELYFNTSTSHSGGDSDFNSACQKAGGLSGEQAICIVERSDGSKPNAGVQIEVWRHFVLVIPLIVFPLVWF